MKKINSYIIEKLHIDKDIEVIKQRTDDEIRKDSLLFVEKWLKDNTEYKDREDDYDMSIKNDYLFLLIYSQTFSFILDLNIMLKRMFFRSSIGLESPAKAQRFVLRIATTMISENSFFIFIFPVSQHLKKYTGTALRIASRQVFGQAEFEIPAPFNAPAGNYGIARIRNPPVYSGPAGGGSQTARRQS